MDPALLLGITEKNGPDLVALVAQCGGPEGALRLMPHLANIWKTVQEYQQKAKAS